MEPTERSLKAASCALCPRQWPSLQKSRYLPTEASGSSLPAAHWTGPERRGAAKRWRENTRCGPHRLLPGLWALPPSELCDFEGSHLSFLKVSILTEWEGLLPSLSGPREPRVGRGVWNGFAVCRPGLSSTSELLKAAWQGRMRHGPEEMGSRRKG